MNKWVSVQNIAEGVGIAERIGFPVQITPTFGLQREEWPQTAEDKETLERILRKALKVSPIGQAGVHGCN